jgi:hypothetical protein
MKRCASRWEPARRSLKGVRWLCRVESGHSAALRSPEHCSMWALRRVSWSPGHASLETLRSRVHAEWQLPQQSEREKVEQFTLFVHGLGAGVLCVATGTRGACTTDE